MGILSHGELAENGVTLNETAQDEHIGDIKWYIQTVNERIARLVIEMAKLRAFWLNGLASSGCISEELSPRTIVMG